jgi:hypothetical protein
MSKHIKGETGLIQSANRTNRKLFACSYGIIGNWLQIKYKVAQEIKSKKILQYSVV